MEVQQLQLMEYVGVNVLLDIVELIVKQQIHAQQMMKDKHVRMEEQHRVQQVNVHAPVPQIIVVISANMKLAVHKLRLA